MARSLRLEPSSLRTACCSPVLVEVEEHEGLVKQGSLLQQVDGNVAAPASTTCAKARAPLQQWARPENCRCQSPVARLDHPLLTIHTHTSVADDPHRMTIHYSSHIFLP